MVNAFQPNAFQANAFQAGPRAADDFVGTDLIDYIWQYPDLGSFQRDPVLSLTMAKFNVVGVSLLIYNPVEALQPAFGSIAIGNNLVLPPQLANSSVALSGYWAMTTFRGVSNTLQALPNIQIVNDRTSMFAREASVLLAKIDVTHINIVINSFGVYVTDGLDRARFRLIDFGMPILVE